MKNKGFTLVELLVVIALLSLLAVITVPAVIAVINKSKTNANNIQKATIINAAKKYYAQDPNRLPVNNSKCVTISKLKSEGLLPSGDLKNPQDNSTYNGSVKVSWESNKYTYKYQNKVTGCS